MTAFLLNINKIFPKMNPVNRTLCNISHFTPEYLSISLLFLCFSVSISLSVVLCSQTNHGSFTINTWTLFLFLCFSVSISLSVVLCSQTNHGSFTINTWTLFLFPKDSREVSENVNMFFKTAKQKPSELNVYGLK